MEEEVEIIAISLIPIIVTEARSLCYLISTIRVNLNNKNNSLNVRFCNKKPALMKANVVAPSLVLCRLSKKEKTVKETPIVKIRV
jgi:hypothetical protein